MTKSDLPRDRGPGDVEQRCDSFVCDGLKRLLEVETLTRRLYQESATMSPP